MTNSLIAVASGFMAQFIADFFGVEYVFDFAALVLFTSTILAAFILDENYGKSDTVKHFPFKSCPKVSNGTKDVGFAAKS